MKKTIIYLLLLMALVLVYAAWNVMGPTVTAPEGNYFYVRTGDTYEEVEKGLVEKHVLANSFFFNLIAKRIGYPNHVRPGKYQITDHSSLLGLIRMLHSGRQEEVRFVVKKLRTKEDLAGKIGARFEADSSEVIRFLTSNDSLAPYQLDTNTVMTVFIPNSYLCWWNGPFKKLFERMKKQHDFFWDGTRTEKAKATGMSPEQIYTIASIVEEETNMPEDKGKIASVYFNRIKKGMKLEADPTVKYAMRNFELKRILHGHLAYPSEYNTYYKTGLPPGPICIPSISTIDAVLDAPKTDFIFFVAKPDFSGYSNFAATYKEHLTFAKAYQKALDSLMAGK
jgi:UPF0755 protein